MGRGTRELVVVCGAALLVGGCAASRWEEEYVPSSGVHDEAALPKDVRVPVREVPWDRLQAGLKHLEAERTASDTPASEWSAEMRQASKTALLRTLQVTDDAADVTVVGRSDFRSTSDLRPETSGRKDLEKLARKIGATEVVWSRRLLGKADTIVQEPVTTYSSGWDDSWGRRHRGGFIDQSSTSWVPVRVQADEYAYVAYFLRKDVNLYFGEDGKLRMHDGREFSAGARGEQ